MKGNSVRTRLITLLAAVAFAAAGALALSPMIMDEAYAAGDATNYDYDATAAPADLEAMPGVYRVQVDMNNGAEPKTIGIPTVAKQNLTDGATKELPAIIMGAAVNYEVRTGAVKYKKLKKKAQTLKVSKVIKVVNKGQGALSYAKASGNKKITVSKTGKVTVKKGLKKGTYKVKVNVTAAGDQYYKAVTKTLTFKVRVK